MYSMTMLISQVTITEYRIHFSFVFNSSDVVYLLECSVCGLQYVAVHVLQLELGLITISHVIVKGASVLPHDGIFRHLAEDG